MKIFDRPTALIISLTCKTLSCFHAHNMSFPSVEFEGQLFFIAVLFILLYRFPTKTPFNYRHYPLEARRTAFVDQLQVSSLCVCLRAKSRPPSCIIVLFVYLPPPPTHLHVYQITFWGRKQDDRDKWDVLMAVCGANAF